MVERVSTKVVWLYVEGQRQKPAGTVHLSLTLVVTPRAWRAQEEKTLTHSGAYNNRKPRHSLPARPQPPAGPNPRPSQVCIHAETFPISAPRSTLQLVTHASSQPGPCATQSGHHPGSNRAALPVLQSVCQTERLLCV